MKALVRSLMLTALMVIAAQGYSGSKPVDKPDPAPANEAMIPTADPGLELQGAGLQDAGMQFPVLRTLGGMGLVIFLMLGAFLAARKYAPRYFNKPSSQKSLKIVETLSMGDKRAISLIEVANSRFLVGSTPHQINLLASLPESVPLCSEPAEVVAISKSAPQKGPGLSFKNLFELEKSRPTKHTADPLPEDLRMKMRQLRDALERP